MTPRGFTLLEMVVVLAIVGLVTALVAPAALRQADRWQARLALQDLEQQIGRLPTLARSAGVELVLGGERPWPPSLPPLRYSGGALEFTQPLVIRSNGYCEGGRLRFARGAVFAEADLLPPYCRMRLREDDGA